MICRAPGKVSRRNRALLGGGGVDRRGQTVGGPADPGQLRPPPPDQIGLDPPVLGGAGVAGGDAPGLIGGLAPAGALGVDLGRPLGMDLDHLVGDAGDPPVSELPRRPRIGHDGIAQLHRGPGRGHPADHGGGVQMLTPDGGVGRLPPAFLVEHFDQVRHQHMIMRTGITGAGGGVAGMGVDQPARLRGDRGAAPASAHLAGDPVQVGQGGVTLGVHDLMHVLGPADDPQLGHRLVRRYDDLQARPPGRYQPLPAAQDGGRRRARRAPRTPRRSPSRPSRASGAAAAPHQGCLTPGRVVGQRPARVVVAVLDDRRAVVLAPTPGPSSASIPLAAHLPPKAPARRQAPGLQSCSKDFSLCTT